MHWTCSGCDVVAVFFTLLSFALRCWILFGPYPALDTTVLMWTRLCICSTWNTQFDMINTMLRKSNGSSGTVQYTSPMHTTENWMAFDTSNCTALNCPVPFCIALRCTVCREHTVLYILSSSVLSVLHFNVFLRTACAVLLCTEQTTAKYCDHCCGVQCSTTPAHCNAMLCSVELCCAVLYVPYCMLVGSA